MSDYVTDREMEILAADLASVGVHVPDDEPQPMDTSPVSAAPALVPAPPRNQQLQLKPAPPQNQQLQLIPAPPKNNQQLLKAPAPKPAGRHGGHHGHHRGRHCHVCNGALKGPRQKREGLCREHVRAAEKERKENRNRVPCSKPGCHNFTSGPKQKADRLCKEHRESVQNNLNYRKRKEDSKKRRDQVPEAVKAKESRDIIKKAAHEQKEKHEIETGIMKDRRTAFRCMEQVKARQQEAQEVLESLPAPLEEIGAAADSLADALARAEPRFLEL